MSPSKSAKPTDISCLTRYLTEQPDHLTIAHMDTKNEAKAVAQIKPEEKTRLDNIIKRNDEIRARRNIKK